MDLVKYVSDLRQAADFYKENCPAYPDVVATYRKSADIIEELIGAKEITYGEWVMAVDDFEDGFGNRELPHCSNCNRGVYRHDAGSWCPFCGSAMKNPMR